MTLSIIITAWNVENFIEQALESCAQAGAETCEFIVIDDGSTDRTAALIERFIATDGADLNMRLIRKARNEGPGPARNAGMDAAAGDYLLFLDGDDWLARGFLPSLVMELEANSPDVLVFNHDIALPNGDYDPNPRADLLRGGWVDTLPQRQRLMANFGVAWNKAYRAAFLRAHGLRFSPGLYEDVSWAYPVLMLAERVRTLPEVGVHYRRRAGSILLSRGPEHFDAIQAQRRLFDFVASDPERLAAFGAHLEAMARRQLLHVYAQGRIPHPLRGTYLHAAFELLREWRAAAALPIRDWGYRVFRLGGWFGYEAVMALRRLCGRTARTPERPAANRGAVEAFRRVRDRFRAIAYALMRRTLPVQPKKVLLESYWGARADCNPLALAKALGNQGGFDLVWSLSPGALVPKDLPGRRVRRGSLAMLYEAATAGHLVNNANFSDMVVKRPGTIHLQTCHGTPLKLMGLDIRLTNPQEMSDWNLFAQRCQRWDYVLSSNPHSSRAWRRAYPYSYKMIESGYPRNDLFFAAADADKARIRRSLGVPEGKRVALYAPTVRDDLRGKPLALGSDVFNAKAVAEALGDEYILLVRAHYFLDKTEHLSNQAIDVSLYPDSNEIALVTDLLITDYSSMMFDFACLRRPVVLYQYDLADYSGRRGVYFDVSACPPGPVVFTQDALIACLQNRAYATAEACQKIDAFAAHFAPWDDGRASARVLEQVFGLRAADGFGKDRS